MLKRALIGGGVSLLLMGLLFGRETVSYLCTSVGWVKQSVKQNVPVDFKIQRAERMIDQLEPEIHRIKHAIVKEEVAVEHLGEQIASLDARQENAKHDLMRMRADLEKGDSYVYYNNVRYSSDQVRQDLANRFQRFKTYDETLLHLRKAHHAREKTLEVSRQKLEEMLNSRNQLMATVTKLAARQKMLEVAKATSEFSVDDSALARTKDLVTEIETQLDVAERLLDADLQFHPEIPLDGPEHEDILEQVAEYFAAESPKVESPKVESIAAEMSADPQL